MADSTDTDAGQDGSPDAGASQDATAEGTKAGTDNVSLLTSRLNGQTAKVGTLTTEKATLVAEKAALEQQLREALDGKVSSDDAAKALVAAKDKELADERNARKAESLKVRFPETFDVLGDAASSLDEAALAAAEARLKGDSGEESPTPRVHNESKTKTTTAVKKEESAADIEARLLSMALPEAWKV